VTVVVDECEGRLADAVFLQVVAAGHRAASHRPGQPHRADSDVRPRPRSSSLFTKRLLTTCTRCSTGSGCSSSSPKGRSRSGSSRSRTRRTRSSARCVLLLPSTALSHLTDARSRSSACAGLLGQQERAQEQVQDRCVARLPALLDSALELCVADAVLVLGSPCMQRCRIWRASLASERDRGGRAHVPRPRRPPAR